MVECKRESEFVIDDYKLDKRHEKVRDFFTRAAKVRDKVENIFYHTIWLMLPKQGPQSFEYNGLGIDSEKNIFKDMDVKRRVGLIGFLGFKNIEEVLVSRCKDEYEGFIRNVIKYFNDFIDDLRSVFHDLKCEKYVKLSKERLEENGLIGYSISDDCFVFSIPNTGEGLDFSKSDVTHLQNKALNKIKNLIDKLNYVLYFIMNRFKKKLVASDL